MHNSGCMKYLKSEFKLAVSTVAMLENPNVSLLCIFFPLMSSFVHSNFTEVVLLPEGSITVHSSTHSPLNCTVHSEHTH